MLVSSALLWSFTEQHYNLLSCSIISSHPQMHFALRLFLVLNRSGKKSHSNAKLIINAGTKVQPDKNPWSDDSRSWYADKCVLRQPCQWKNCFWKWSDMHRLSHCSSTARLNARITTVISYSHGLRVFLCFKIRRSRMSILKTSTLYFSWIQIFVFALCTLYPSHLNQTALHIM